MTVIEWAARKRDGSMYLPVLGTRRLPAGHEWVRRSVTCGDWQPAAPSEMGIIQGRESA